MKIKSVQVFYRLIEARGKQPCPEACRRPGFPGGWYLPITSVEVEDDPKGETYKELKPGEVMYVK